MVEQEALSITPEIVSNSSEEFKTEIKDALIKSAEQILGKVIWFLLPKKLKAWINAVLVYMKNH